MAWLVAPLAGFAAAWALAFESEPFAYSYFLHRLETAAPGIFPPMAKVKLHRCSYTFLHVDADACWRLQKALDEEGVDYEVVKHGWGKSEKSRTDVVELSGQKFVPVLELADGSVYREETDDMVSKLKSGDLPGPTS